MGKSIYRPHSETLNRNGKYGYYGEYSSSSQHSYSYADSVNTGDSPPNWREVIRSGGDATSSLSGVKHRFSGGTGYFQAVYNDGWKEETTGHITVPYVDPTPVDIGYADLYAMAVGKAENALAKSYRKNEKAFQAGVATGEIRETIRSFMQPLKSLRYAVDDVINTMRRLRKKEANPTQLVKNASDAWLEWSFGIKPLIGDAEDAAKAFAYLGVERVHDVVRIEGRAEEKLKSARQSVLIGPPSPMATFGHYVSVRNEAQVNVRIAAGVKTTTANKMRPPDVLFGTTWFDFAPTLWELVPGSFLVDYFTSAGELIDAWSLRFVDFGYLFQTDRVVLTRRCSDVVNTYIPVGGYYNVKSYSSGGGFTSTRTYVDRGTRSATFSGSLHFKIPDSSTKWLNIAALAGSIVNLNRK